jgi:hypothetical protein
MTCGAWIQGKVRPIPEALMERVRGLVRAKAPSE